MRILICLNFVFALGFVFVSVLKGMGSVSVSKSFAKPLVNGIRSLMLLHHKDSTQKEFKLFKVNK